jgi:hypothetical protein
MPRVVVRLLFCPSISCLSQALCPDVPVAAEQRRRRRRGGPQLMRGRGPDAGSLCTVICLSKRLGRARAKCRGVFPACLAQRAGLSMCGGDAGLSRLARARTPLRMAVHWADYLAHRAGLAGWTSDQGCADG